MCKALEDLVEEGRIIGRAEAREEMMAELAEKDARIAELEALLAARDNVNI